MDSTSSLIGKRNRIYKALEMTEDLTNKAGTWIIELKDLREKILFYEAASRKARAEFLSKL